MTVFKHELRQGRLSLLIWSLIIGSMLSICVLIYPQMVTQMEDITKMFADMGSFTQAFGMDKINFGEFTGYFGVECGNSLGISGAFFAALLGISALAKEERDKTAEFLLTHPLSRTKIVAEKAAAVVVQILILNIFVFAVTVLSVLAIDVTVDWAALLLLLLSYVLMQIEIAAITFGISAFIRKGSLGIGIGLAALFYFVNIIANLMEETKFLKYFTPFGYTEGADIISSKSLNMRYLLVGAVITVACVVLAFVKYNKKDIAG